MERHMNSSKTNKILRVCALFCIAAALYKLIAGGAIYSYLHPRTLPLVKISYFIFLILIIFNIRDKVTNASSRKINWKIPVLFVPVMLGFYVKPAGFSSRIAMQKGLTSVVMSPVKNRPEEAMKNPEEKSDTVQMEKSIRKTVIPVNAKSKEKEREKNTPIDTLREDSMYLKLDKIYSDPDKFTGEVITMVGFVAPDTVLGRNSFFLGRMMIACCAADAMPVGFYCTTDTVLGIYENDWIILTGTINAQNIKLPWDDKKRKMPVIRVGNVKKTIAPVNQYVYPAVY
jgi:putative membrane protein